MDEGTRKLVFVVGDRSVEATISRMPNGLLRVHVWDPSRPDFEFSLSARDEESAESAVRGIFGHAC